MGGRATTASPSHKWQFQTRFRKGAFGWRGSRLAIERIAFALSEIRSVARVDAVAGADGAIRFLERVSPALEQVDGSSGAIGSAVNAAIRELVPLIANAPVELPLRRKWLDRLWQAFCDDQIPYIERLGDRWGELCAEPEIAAEWIDRLLPLVRENFAAERTRRSYIALFNGAIPCFSALLATRRYGDVFELLDAAPYVWWEYRRWGFRALVAQGRNADALRFAEASRESTGNSDLAIAAACERLLLESGMADEAYQRYGIAASARERTYVGRFRALVKKYPSKPNAELLRDLVASTPGREGKWFAAAKNAGLYDEAIALANATQCDPKTLGRAARDFVEKRPEFALEAARAALRWFADGFGFDVTRLDVVDAYRYGEKAAEQLGRGPEYRARVREVVDRGTNAFVCNVLRSIDESRTRSLDG